jgi:hypothetical protein
MPDPTSARTHEHHDFAVASERANVTRVTLADSSPLPPHADCI